MQKIVQDLSVTQNFLINDALVRQLLEKTNITGNDIVYDFGAGDGNITRQLQKIAKKVIALEFDQNLITKLNNTFGFAANVQIVNADILQYHISEQSYKVFANIPFNITSKIFNKLFLAENTPEAAYLIMQKESAKRFLGEGEGYLISTIICAFYQLKIMHEFSPQDFSPSPNVKVVLFAAEKHSTPLLNIKDKLTFFDFVTYVTLQQKPTLKLRLNKIFTYEQLKRFYADTKLSSNISLKDISIDIWIALFSLFLKYADDARKGIIKGAFVKYKSIPESAPVGTRTKIKRKKVIT